MERLLCQLYRSTASLSVEWTVEVILEELEFYKSQQELRSTQIYSYQSTSSSESAE